MEAVQRPAYEMQPFEGIRNTARLGVAFLVGHLSFFSPDDFAKLRQKEPLAGRQLMARMERWIGRPDGKWEDDKYHGWTQSEHGGAHVMCFVFKFKKHRIYGFLCNPDALNPRFRVFVPVIHAMKKGDDTDVTLLDRIADLSRDSQVMACTRTLAAPLAR